MKRRQALAHVQLLAVLVEAIRPRGKVLLGNVAVGRNARKASSGSLRTTKFANAMSNLIASMLTDFKDVATLVGLFLALVTLIKGIYEYRKQGAQKRIELYLNVRRRFDDNRTFSEIRQLLDDDDPEVANVPFKDRSDYAAYFEEIALLENTGVIKPDVAFYMFGWEAIQCWNSEPFWKDFPKEDRYWGLFRMFVREMQSKERQFQLQHKLFRF